jgi:hypothetical protein
MIADIHGNDVALRAVLKDADRLGVDRWWALGDLVLFGPAPRRGAGTFARPAWHQHAAREH